MLRLRDRALAGMDNNVLIALIGSSSSGLVAITALVLNYRGFAWIDSRFASIECRLDMMQVDMKDLNKTMTALEVDVALVKDKVGL
jgi:hypothetical protein